MEQLTAGGHQERAARLAAGAGATALVVSGPDGVIMSSGDPAMPVHCRSIRKSLLSALFARPVRDAAIDLDATLADLGIGESVPPPLTALERSARVRDLLTCRSGVYHPSNHQPARDRAALPPRGAYPPGTHFLYSNWDFNALGTILERAIGRSMFEEFADVIAAPAGLQDFHLPAQRYATQAWSEHRTYAFHVSTRDLARFGEIYLRGGRAGDREIIPAQWVAQSTRAHTPTGRGPGGAGPGYGYLWWAELDGALFAGTVMPAGSFAAYGNGGQFLLVIPALQRVIALLADPARPGGTDAAPRRPLLARIVHHATAGVIPLGEPGAR